MSILAERRGDYTFRVSRRSGVWTVTRDHAFYGDFLFRAEAVRQACAAAVAVEALGGAVRVLAPPGETLVPHRDAKPPP